MSAAHGPAAEPPRAAPGPDRAQTPDAGADGDARPTPAGPAHVHDADAVRAARTASLLDALAGALGAPLARATVVVDDTAAAALRPHGARGLVRGGRILLDPARYDPGNADGRRLLAHEAVHLAQQRGPAPAPAGPARGLAAAEGEAERLARALAAGGAAAGPRVRLDAAEAPLDVGFERLSLADVEGAHAGLLAALRGLVGEGAPDAEAVDAAVEQLDTTELAAGAGAVHALEPPRRRGLAERLSDHHRRERRHGALAVLLGLEREERRADLDAGDLGTLDLSGLTPAEHHGAVDLLRSLRVEVLTTLVEEADNRLAVERLMSSPLPETAADEGPEAPARPDDPTPRGPVPGADPDDPRVQAAVRGVRADLAERSRDGALRALRRLGRLFQPPRERPAGEAGPPAPPAGLALLSAAVDALEADGSVDRLLEGLPEDHAELDERDRRAIDAVLTVRPLRRGEDRLVDPNAERAERLLSRSIVDWAVTDSDARQAYPLVLAVARTRPSVLTRLDAHGKVDTLFDELPDDFLYRADIRATTGEIMAERTPDRLFERAREKLSRSFLDWAVTARDAYLASRMVEALPPGRREAFAELDGGALWARMTEEMTGSMREAVDRHGFDRANALAHRDQVRTQLADPALWTDEQVATLRTLVVFALTLGDGEWVFDRSREFAAHEQPEVRRRVVTPFALYDPDAGRETWDPDTLRGTGFFEEGIFQAAADVIRMLGAGVALLGDLTLAVTERGLDASVSLERVADLMGGDLAGARVRTAEEATADAARGTTETPRPEGTNRVRVRWEAHGEDGAGRLALDLPALDLAGYERITHGRTLKFGRLRLDGLHVAATYTTGERHRPTNLAVRGDGLDVADLLHGGADSLAGASRLRTGALEVRGTDRVPSSVPEATPGRTLGFWAALVAIFERIGAILDLSDTWESQAAALTAFEVHLASLRVDGFVSGDRRVGTIAATDLRIGYATSALGRLRLLERSLERRLDRAGPEAQDALRARLDEVRAEIRDRERGEAERQRLEDRYQRDPASLTEPERARLRRLRGQGGVTIDAAALRLSDVGGSVRAGRLDLEGVAAEARFPGTLPAYAPTGVQVREFLDVGPPGAHDLERPHVRLHVTRAAFGDVTVAGDVPTADDLRERLAEAEEALADAAPDEDTAALQDRRDALARALTDDLPAYEALETRARDRLAAPLSAAEERTRAALRARLRALDAIRVRAGTLDDLEVDADLAGAVHRVAARAAEVEGIEAGGLGVERLAGTDLAAGVTADRPGAEGLANLPDSLRAATARAGTLDVHGLSSGGRRLVEHVHVEAADAAVERTAEGWRLERFHLDRLAVTGFRVAAGEGALTTSAPDGTDATVELVDVDAAGDLRVSDEGAFEHVTVDSLEIGAVRAPRPLHYTEPGGRRLRLAVDAIRGIRVTGLEVPLSGDAPLPTAGRVQVQAIDRLTVAGRFTSALAAAVRVDSDPRAGATLDVRFTPEGVEVEDFRLGTIRADRLVFDDGVRHVEVDGPATLRDVTAAAAVDVAAGEITVSRFRVERLTAPSVSYRDTTRELVATGGFDSPDAVTVEGLWARGLRLSTGGDLRGAELGVERLRAGIAGTFAPGVEGGVEVDVEGVGLEVGPAFSRIRGSVASLRARGGFAADDGTIAGFDIQGLGVGAVEWDGRSLRLGTDREDGLTIDRIALTTVAFASADLELDLGTTGPGSAALTGVRVKATVEFAESGGEVDFAHFSAELDEVHADQLAVEGLTVRLPGHDLELVLPAGFVTTAGPIDIVPNPPERLLVERVPALAGARLDVQGRVEIPRVVVPRVEAGFGGWVSGATRLELDELRVGMLHSGEVALSLDRIAALGTSLRADLRAAGVGAATGGASPGFDIEATLRDVRAALLPFRDVLAHTSGHLRADLTLVDLPLVGDWQERLDLTIVDGQLDLHRLEDALGNLGDLVLDFRVAAPGLVLEADFSDVAAPIGGLVGGPLGGGLGLAAKVRLVEWNLTTGEQNIADRDEVVDLLTLLDADVADWAEARVRSATAGPATPGPAAVRLDDIDLALDIRNPAPIRLSRPLGGSSGERIETVVPADALVGLRATGNLPGPAGSLALRVERVAFGRTDLRLAAAGGMVEAGAESVVLEGGSADVAFRGGPGGRGGTAYPPTSTTASLRALTARGVDVRWIPGRAP